MPRKKKSGGERAVDKVTGGLTETAGMISGDESLEAEGRTIERSADHKTYTVTPRDDGSWEVRTEGATRATGVHETKEVAVSQAKELARKHPPGQVLVYKRDGTVQTEQTYA